MAKWSNLAIAGLVLATGALLAGAPNVLRVGFPALAMVVAMVLFAGSRTRYVQYCFWLWFLSPLLRRLVDYRTEFVATSPLLLAPLLAAAVSGVVLIPNLRTLGRRENSGAIPFACAFAGVAFGTIFGLTRYGPVDVARGLINWIAPVLFGFFLYQECLRDEARYKELRDTIVRTMLWGTLLLSLYGVVQFFVLPAWDLAWMEGLQDYAFGQPRPLELRVFSTMNAPAIFASYMMAGLLIAFAELTRDAGKDRVLAGLAAPCGLLALALTTSRSLWLGLVLGVVYLAFALPSRARVRVVATVLATLVVAAIATQAPGIHEVVVARLASFTSGTNDVSANARIKGHADALLKLTREPLGEGMGSLDADHATDGSDDSLGPHDSTLLEFLFALGGPGTLVYAFGVGFGLWKIFSGTGDYAFKAVLAAFFGQCLLTSILVGVPGFMVWVCVGMGLAGRDLARGVYGSGLWPRSKN